MARKQASISRPMLFTWLMLSGWILLLAPQTVTNKLHFTFVRIFEPVLGLGRSLSASSHTAGEVVSRRQFVELENHAANLLVQLHEARQKYEQLAGLRARLGLESAAFVLADVITVGTDSLKHEIVINRGERDGLVTGQFVLGNNSVIGVIGETSANAAKVRLITDTTLQVHVKIASGDAYIHWTMQGDGRSGARLRMKYRVSRGDNVYACEQPGLLDTPIIVGKVARCQRDDTNPLLWDITVEPACDIHLLETVAVIVMNPSGTG